VAVIALPAVSAASIGYARGTSDDWANIALAHALGYALYVPVWISVCCPHAAVRHAPHVPWGFVGVEMVMLFVLAVFWYLLGDRVALRPLLCLAPAPIVISACVRTQMTGSSIMVFVIVILAAQLSVWGKGPFIAETPQQTTLALQLWTLAVALSAITLSVVAEQRASARRDLIVAHRDLREMAGRLIATMEQERARLARDLHDDINQRLAASSIGLSALRRCVGPKLRDDVTAIQTEIIALSEDVRHLSHSLHPSSLVHAGLHGALESLCAGQCRAKGPRIFLVADRRVDDLPSEIALCFYRIAQEALTNALRHASAKKITIKVSVAVEQASLWIFDDGAGFDAASSIACRSGIGLISMQERTRLLGGSFDLRSAPGRGVDLCVRIPLATN
jgi:signal transduction histidine kinase